MKQNGNKSKRGNPGYDPWVIELCLQLVRDYPDEGPDSIHSRMKKELQGKRANEEIESVGGYLPTSRTIRTWKEKYKPIITGEIEQPWCLGVSDEKGIPVGANPDLLKISLWCLAVGRRFTIREAQWVARLRGAVDFEHLLNRASNYAIRERVHEVLKGEFGKERFDTADLDLDTTQRGIPCGSWLDATDMLIGLIPGQEVRAKIYGMVGAERQREWELWGGFQDYLTYMWLSASKAVKLYLGLEYLGMETDKVEQLPQGVDATYAIWLRKLSEGPKWKDLTPQERQTLASRLFKEIGDGYKAAKTEALHKSVVYGWNVEFRVRYIPSPELFQQVGLEDLGDKVRDRNKSMASRARKADSP